MARWFLSLGLAISVGFATQLYGGALGQEANNIASPRCESAPVVDFVLSKPDESCVANCPQSGHCPAKELPCEVTQIRVLACDKAGDSSELARRDLALNAFEGLPPSIPASTCRVAEILISPGAKSVEYFTDAKRSLEPGSLEPGTRNEPSEPSAENTGVRRTAGKSSELEPLK